VKKINILLNTYTEQLDGWSNSLGNLESTDFGEFNKIQISDLKDDSYFILPISCGGLHRYLDILDRGGSGGKTFLYFLDDRVRNLICEGNGYILIIYIHEGHIQHQNYKDLHNELLKYQIPANKVFFVSSNISGKKQYKNFCDKMPTLTKFKINII